MHPLIKGSARSLTMWCALVLGVLSNVQAMVPAFLAQIGLHAPTVQAVGTAMSILMVVLRTITTQSLTDKGQDNAPPASPPSA
jgi:hypothetical protein